MKNFKRFSAAIAAALMAASLSVPMAMNVSAAENTISFSGEVANSGHTYTAYKIFGGTVKTTPANGENPAKTELTNIVWANPNGSGDFLTALKDDTTIGTDFINCFNPAEVAMVLKDYENNSPKAKAFAKVVVANKDKVATVNTIASSTIRAEEDGYYVIVESPLNGTPESSAMTSYLLAVYDASEGAELEVKSSVPTVIKKIKENSTLDTSVGTKDNNMESYTIPAGYNDTADFSIGDTVSFQIVGSMPSNIDDYSSYKYVFYDTLDSAFTFNSNSLTVKVGDTTIDSDKYNVTSENGTITISFSDIISAGVTLDASSKVIVDYTAVLSDTATTGQAGQKNSVYLEYSNNPNFGGEGETDTTSKTPPDTVIAFTYELDVTKIDGANVNLKLSGAEFKLKATNGEHSGKWVKVDASGRVSGWADTEDDGSVLRSSDGENDKGIFKVIGLDDGTYSLKETKAPNGYNLLSDEVAFTITADTSNSQNDNIIDGTELTALSIKVGSKEEDGDLSNGTVDMTVENNSGSTLPSTGGMGTKLFFIGGGSMAAAAGIILIAKKRMGKNAD